MHCHVAMCFMNAKLAVLGCAGVGIHGLLLPLLCFYMHTGIAALMCWCLGCLVASHGHCTAGMANGLRWPWQACSFACHACVGSVWGFSILASYGMCLNYCCYRTLQKHHSSCFITRLGVHGFMGIRFSGIRGFRVRGVRGLRGFQGLGFIGFGL